MSTPKGSSSGSSTAPDETVQTIKVDLGARAYDIHVGPGLMARAGTLIAPLLKRPKVLIVTDENVARHVLPALEASLHEAGISRDIIILPPGEATKTFDQLQRLVDAFLQARLERDDLVIALGGGVIGDLTGFAAAILKRGVGFIQIPTSLLAQVDSSVGGKTGINTRFGKTLWALFTNQVLSLPMLKFFQPCQRGNCARVTLRS